MQKIEIRIIGLFYGLFYLFRCAHTFRFNSISMCTATVQFVVNCFVRSILYLFARRVSSRIIPHNCLYFTIFPPHFYFIFSLFFSIFTKRNNPQAAEYIVETLLPVRLYINHRKRNLLHDIENYCSRIMSDYDQSVHVNAYVQRKARFKARSRSSCVFPHAIVSASLIARQLSDVDMCHYVIQQRAFIALY